MVNACNSMTLVNRRNQFCQPVGNLTRSGLKSMEIINFMEGSGVLLTRAQDAVNHSDLSHQLIIVQNYRALAVQVKISESSGYSVSKALNGAMDFGTDPCLINDYILKRIEGSDFLFRFQQWPARTCVPADYLVFSDAPTISIPMERSFFILKSILKKTDRSGQKMLKTILCCALTHLRELPYLFKCFSILNAALFCYSTTIKNKNWRNAFQRCVTCK